MAAHSLSLRTPRWSFALQLLFTLVVCAFLIGPVVVSAVAGVTENYFLGISSGFTLRWLDKVWELYSVTVWRSLGIALAAVTSTVILGVPLAYFCAVRRDRLARIIEEMLMLPVAIPGLASALGLILVYGSLREFRSSSAFILVGHVLFTLPFMVRAVLAVMLAQDLPTLEEVAASLGAGPLRRFFTVIVPNCASGITAGALMVLALSIGEFNMTWMLHTPTTQTLPVGLADSYASMRLEIGSAYTLVFLAILIPLLILTQAFSRLFSPNPAR